MKSLLKKGLIIGSVLSMAAVSAIAASRKEITVAYFLQWPTPNQVAQVEEIYDRELGVKVNWRAFDTGVAMSAAMASGDVDIAYSQGVSPFVIAVSQGLALKTVGIALSYADNDNCIIHKDAGITKANAADLEGKRVAVPFGTVPYYKVLRQFEHLGVDHTKVKLVDLPPPEGAAALSRADVAMACGWGGAFNEMKKYGSVLMTPDELAEIGVFVFDVISVTDSFADEHPELIIKFLQVTENYNNNWKTGNKQEMASVVSKAAGMSLEDTQDNLSKFEFPSRDEQLVKWFNGSVAKFYAAVGDVLKGSGDLPRTLPDYSSTIDTTFLTLVK